MKRLEFQDLIDFAYAVNDKYNNEIKDGRYTDIAIIAKYYEAVHLITEFVSMGYNLHSIEINDVDCNGYNDEYLISLCKMGIEDEIWCEPMLRENGYLNDYSAVIYVMDNCSSKVLSHLNSKNIFEVGIGRDLDECPDKCCKYFGSNYNERKHKRDKIDISDDMHGFSINKSDENTYNSFSFYSNDKELVAEMAKIFR